MTTPPVPPRDEQPRSAGSWWPFRRHRDEDEARLGPAEPTGFDWIGDGPADDAPADDAPADDATGDDATGGDATARRDPTSTGGAMAPPAQVTNGPGEQDLAVETPAVVEPARRVTCPACRTEVDDGAFCEECGADLAVATTPAASPEGAPTAPSPAAPSTAPSAAAPSTAPSPVPRYEAPPGDPAHPSHPGGIAGRDHDGLLVLGGAPALVPEAAPLPHGGICTECGGTYDPDGYCENCGAKAADPRHHYAITRTPWLAGVCDRGVKHPGNEDALALRGGDAPTGQRVAIVVCDGVSSAPHSAAASAAAAEAAAEVLTTSHARGVGGVEAALIGALGRRLEAAADAAAEAVATVSRAVERADDRPGQQPDQLGGGPSCTFVAAVVEDGAGVVGSVGDSRAYWFPDDGPAVRLTEDDSWAAEQIRGGTSREEAEAGPHAHTITRWLGEDCPDHRPALTTLDLSAPGWLLVCTDGLWNYASEPAALAAVVRDRMAAVHDRTTGAAQEQDVEQPAAELAAALVEWAKAQGGHDNITVALAYLLPHGGVLAPASAPAAAAPDVPLGAPPSLPRHEGGSGERSAPSGVPSQTSPKEEE